MNTKFYMMIGLPGSGKSHIANQLKENDDFIVHSSDAIREEFNYNTTSDNVEVFRVLHERVIQDLSDGRNVIMDATNLSAKKRKHILSQIAKIKDCYKQATIIATEFNECLARNKSREAVVPESVIHKMRERFEFPMLSEGFDNIVIINNFNPEEYKDIYFGWYSEGILDVEQDNKYHDKTIAKHCLATADYVLKNYEDKSAYGYTQRKNKVFAAALFHDVGKVYTKTYEDKKGNTSENAHYYGHENVSAYESMFWLNDYYNNSQELTIYSAQLIAKHMQPYSWKERKTHEKYIKLYGKDFYDDLLFLNEADQNSHWEKEVVVDE